MNTPEKLKVAIVIPTMNRADFLIRQLRYYASVNCPHPIYIDDASEDSNADRLKAEVENLKNHITISYSNPGKCTNFQSMLNLLSRVKENYVAYCGDDDYLIPGTLTRCAEFLDQHADFSTAQGKAVSFRLQDQGAYGKLKKIANYPRRSIEADSARDRFTSLMQNYFVSLFAVHRAAQIKKNFLEIGTGIDRSFAEEILLVALDLVEGKSKTLDELGLVRQIHERHYELPDTYDWLTSEKFHDAYAQFESMISRAIAASDTISQEAAKKAVKRGFWAFLKYQLEREFPFVHKDLEKPKTVSLRNKIAKRFPLLRRVYQNICSFNGDKNLHAAVLQPKSKYYYDFKPVMESFSKTP